MTTPNADSPRRGCPVPFDWVPEAPQMLGDVHAVLDEQRATCPVPHARDLRGRDYYAALAWDDVVAVATDTIHYSSAAEPRRPDLRRIPVELDPPAHTAVRRILQPYFTPGRMKVLGPRIDELASRALADLLAPVVPGKEGEVEYVDGFATPYPTRVLCEVLGLPQEDWAQLKEWSLGVSTQGFGDGSGPGFAECDAALRSYAAAVVADRRRAPRPVEEDFTSGLLAARPGGEELSDEQLVGILRLMFSAGHLTTTIALGIVTEYLARNPQEQAMLRRDPARVDAAVEEVLRQHAPVVANANPRTVVAPVQLGDRLLVPGDRVLPVWGAANRDPRRFEDPTAVDLEREGVRSMTYGHGVHLCLGAAVARHELAEATRQLLVATTAFSVLGEVERGDWWRQRGPTSLRLRLVRA